MGPLHVVRYDARPHRIAVYIDEDKMCSLGIPPPQKNHEEN